MAASLLSDLVKCFECVPHEVLLEEAVKHGFPRAILRTALLSYRAARRVIRERVCSDAVQATRAVLAGCGTPRRSSRCSW